MNPIKIEKVSQMSSQLLDAINTLMPQLSADILPLTFDSLNDIINDPTIELFIAMEGEAIVGTLSLVIKRTPSGLRSTIEDVVVDMNSRNLGIGKMLMESAISQAKEHNVEYIELTSRPHREVANHLYQQLGFQKRETNVYRFTF